MTIEIDEQVMASLQKLKKLADEQSSRRSSRISRRNRMSSDRCRRTSLGLISTVTTTDFAVRWTSSMFRISRRRIGYALLVVLFSVELYFGTYYATVMKIDVGSRRRWSGYFVEYRGPQQISEWLFGPAHELDLILRPDFWKPKPIRQ
jgi:hypothetical protein